MKEAADQVEDCRLSRSIRPDDEQNLAFIHLQRDTLHRAQPTKLPGDVSEFEDRKHIFAYGMNNQFAANRLDHYLMILCTVNSGQLESWICFCRVKSNNVLIEESISSQETGNGQLIREVACDFEIICAHVQPDLVSKQIHGGITDHSRGGCADAAFQVSYSNRFCYV